MARARDCKIVGNFVEPCQTLRDCADDNALPPGKRKPTRGITFVNNLINLKTGERTRNFFMLAGGKFRDRGIVLNVCPFCGKNISEHLEVKEATQP